MLIDSHAHLQFEDFKADLIQTLQRAQQNGVGKIILPGSSFSSSLAGLKLAEGNDNLYAAIGIHPHHLNEFDNQLKRKLTQLIKQYQPIAIGETGFDFYQIDEKDLPLVNKKQQALFKLQIELAINFDLPLIIHSRQAAKETMATLNTYKKQVRGVFHCYANGKKQINAVCELEFYFGLDGNLTYDEGLQNVAKAIPLERILLETDSPELTPLPFRQLRNEPKNVKLVAEKLAEIKGLSFEKIAEVTSNNAKKLFNL